jgi:hypothetical protein
MTRYFLLTLFALTACTAEPFSNNPNAQFHMPLTYGRWETARTADGSCIVTAGYRGVQVTKTTSGMRVSSNQPLVPGERLSLNVNGNHYETPETDFALADAANIVADFMYAREAYLSLRTRDISGHGLTSRDQTIKLDGFAGAMKSCQGSAKKVKKKKA